jgi:diguanylate cyclase (GGDEF)-like protein
LPDPNGNTSGPQTPTGSQPTGDGTNPPNADAPNTTPTSDGTLSDGASNSTNTGAGLALGRQQSTAGLSPADAAQISATLDAITTSPQSIDQAAAEQAKRRAEALAGVQGSFVITKIVNHIPGWMRWALGVLSVFALISGGFALREYRRRRFAEADAMVDALTGISNRKAFDRRLDLEWRRAARYGRSLGLMVMDLDGFKLVNDVNGHAAGDRVLREVAQRLDGRMRDTDLVARIGGDEFAVICPETGINELMTIRRQLSDHATQDLSNKVGLSIGVAEFVPGDDDPQSILARADESMYRVKRGETAGVAA